jgi:hypothetical protein
VKGQYMKDIFRLSRMILLILLTVAVLWLIRRNSDLEVQVEQMRVAVPRAFAKTGSRRQHEDRVRRQGQTFNFQFPAKTGSRRHEDRVRLSIFNHPAFR